MTDVEAISIKQPKVTIIVVTFNRLELLKACLKSTFELDYPDYSVLLIDNASTDGTQDFVLSSPYYQQKNFRYVRLKDNIGGAGGFYEGVRLAMADTSEWLFLMDDDVVILPKALQHCLKYSHVSECIHGSKLTVEGERFLWSGYFSTKLGLFSWFSDNYMSGKEFTFVNYGCFEGMFVKKSLVQKIGLPDARLFITLDDHIFGMLASLHTNVLYFSEFTLRKLLPVPKDWGERSPIPYYQTRNRFFLIDYLREYFPESRPSVIHLFYFLDFLRNTWRALTKGYFYQIGLLIKGYVDGCRRQGGRLGATTHMPTKIETAFAPEQ